ncbi:MAG TPA: peptidyl-prolyl cis-trans isomerase [Burkholderiales bacterium]|nr:peptidyl-prolyl cis-trans isomerase [Burkholderiales bacterium]
MNRSQSLSIAFSIIAALAAPVLRAQSDAVATVNGVKIPASYMDFMLKTQEGRPAAQNAEQLRKVIRENLINQEVVVQEAKRSGLLEKPDVQARLAIGERRAIAQMYMQEWLNANPVTDDEVRKAYDEARAQAGGREYHARHILVDSEGDAKRIIRELDAGASFETLATESKDPGSKGRGGDLGWALPTVYVKPFADAMVALSKGQTTSTPVRTQFGYHVIRLDDVREVQVPPFEKVQQNIRQQLTQRKVAARVNELRDKAKIE